MFSDIFAQGNRCSGSSNFTLTPRQLVSINRPMSKSGIQDRSFPKQSDASLGCLDRFDFWRSGNVQPQCHLSNVSFFTVVDRDDTNLVTHFCIDVTNRVLVDG